MVLLHEKPRKKRRWNCRSIKVEEVLMISIKIGLLLILVALVVISILFYTVKVVGKKKVHVTKERISNDQANEKKHMQGVDDDITKDDAETFLQIVELLDQLY